MEKGSDKKKSFEYVWDMIELSVIILVGYSLFDLIFQINTYIDKVIPASIFSILVTIFAFGTIGYKAAKKEKTPTPGKYGAYSGLIVGFIGAIIGIITFYVFPERIVASIQQAVQAGADPSTVQTFVKIGLYANFVLAPAINAGIGALVAWISGMIFKKK